MAAELVSLRQLVAMLTQSAGNNFTTPPRSPGLPSPPPGHSSALSAGPSQSRLSPKPFQVSIRGNHAVFRESVLLKATACMLSLLLQSFNCRLRCRQISVPSSISSLQVSMTGMIHMSFANHSYHPKQ